MSEHREGTLFYDTETGRYDIRFDLESFYGGLHCGECFDVKVKDIWIPVRIEKLRTADAPMPKKI